MEKMEIPSTEPLADSINRMIETLYDREKMITEYQTELHRQNKFLEAVINSLSDGLVVIDDEHKILRATAKISEWFNVTGKDLLGIDLLEFISNQDTLSKNQYTHFHFQINDRNVNCCLDVYSSRISAVCLL